MNGRAAEAIAIAIALFPPAALAQALSLGATPGPGGAVLGRVCLDRDGDGRCGDGDPGIAGARVIDEGGRIALADGRGRFHLLEVTARTVLTDRAAYGGHVVVAQGLGVRRAFELAPLGAVQVELAVPPPPSAPPPPLASAGSGGGPPGRAPDGRLRWALAGRTAPGSRVAVDGAQATAGPDGLFAVEVLLAPGKNRLGALAVAPGGAAAVFGWTVHLLRRADGSLLVGPEAPEQLAALDVAVRTGGILATGRLPPGARARIAGAVAVPAPDGAFAAFAPPGEATVEILDGDGRALARAVIPAAPRDGLRSAAALAEVEVSVLGDPGLLVSGRGAGAAHARIGPVEIEGGVDLDDRDRRGELADLLRPRDGLVVEHALDPDRTFPVTGDTGAAGDRDPGRGRVWGHVEAPGARLDLGGARAGLTGSELGRYDRALYGAKARGEGELGPLGLEASAFGATLRDDAGANAPPSAAHDVLAATGGAAFWLAHGAVVPGSEAVRVEWRDPLSGRLAAQRPLVRGVDYEIDWTTGRVTLAAPLPSVGGPPAVFTGDPFATAPAAVLVVDYLHAAAHPGGEDLQGGRVGASIGPLAVSAHAANEERPGGSYRLVAGAAALDLGPYLGVRAEVARSRGALFATGGETGFARATDGGYAFAPALVGGGEAGAFHLEARGALGPAKAEAWWREREAGYVDAEFAEGRGARERGAAISAEEGGLSGSVLLAERRGADPADPSGTSLLDARTLVARAGWRAGRLGVVAEGVHSVRDAPARAEETSAGVRGTWQVDPSLALDLSHHQGLRTTGAGRDPTFTAAGAHLALGRSALSVRGGWGPELGPRVLVSGERGGPDEAVYGTFTADPDAPHVLGGAAGTSALGARRRAGAAEVFTEEQFARDAFGLRAARVFGAALAPLEGLRISVSGERGERLRLDGSTVARSAGAGAIGLVRGPLRLAVRGELRAEGHDDQAAAGGSAEWWLSSGAAVSLRCSWIHGTVAGREALGFDASIGGALRADRFSLLGSVARLVDMRPGEGRRDGVVARLAGTAETGTRLEVGLGAALALQKAGGGRDDRLVGSARVRLRIRGPLDAAVEYARRAGLGGGDIGDLDAVRVEAGLSARECRLAVGYTFIGFAGDGLTPAEDTGRLYVRAQLAY